MAYYRRTDITTALHLASFAFTGGGCKTIKKNNGHTLNKEAYTYKLKLDEQYTVAVMGHLSL